MHDLVHVFCFLISLKYFGKTRKNKKSCFVIPLPLFWIKHTYLLLSGQHNNSQTTTCFCYSLAQFILLDFHYIWTILPFYCVSINIIFDEVRHKTLTLHTYVKFWASLALLILILKMWLCTFLEFCLVNSKQSFSSHWWNSSKTDLKLWMREMAEVFWEYTQRRHLCY